jgi:hypothetical protein
MKKLVVLTLFLAATVVMAYDRCVVLEEAYWEG